MKIFKFITVSLLIVGIIAIINNAFASQEKTPQRISYNAVTAQIPKQQTSYKIKRYYSGKTYYRNKSNLGFLNSGTVDFVGCREGDVVSKEQVLISLDNRILEIKRERILAQIKESDALLTLLEKGPRSEAVKAQKAIVQNLDHQLKFLQSKLDRSQTLQEKNLISDQEFDQTFSDHNTTKSLLEIAINQLQELQLGTRSEQIEAQVASKQQLQILLQEIDIQIEQGSIKAPFDGLVVKQEAEVGDIITPAQAIVSIIDPKAIEVRIAIPQKVVNSFQNGAEHKITIVEQDYTGKIHHISPILENSTYTLDVVFHLNNNGNIREGQIGRVTFLKNINTPGYWLPVDTVFQGDRTLWYCFVLNEMDKEQQLYQVKKHNVKILHSNAYQVFIAGKHLDNCLVIFEGLHKVVPNQIVTLSRE